ncbi:hypothetical protein JOF56_009673 [Kibdelosporangium banguiense]|uniref:Uncharacterized protein n=1 Tax=Kibdelosporangium banguiense TaxID=1365924 RepID=A0ABS4TZ66_9PSEU|nr:hypothetical protein [Kibdelosporangium banguiense]
MARRPNSWSSRLEACYIVLCIAALPTLLILAILPSLIM